MTSCLEQDIELRKQGQTWSEDSIGHFYQKMQVGLPWAPTVARLLWEVAIDESSKYQSNAAFFACFLEHKIGEQLSFSYEEEDQLFYANVIESLKEKVQRVAALSHEQLKDRPEHWPPIKEE